MKIIKNTFIEKDYLYDNGLIKKFSNSMYYKGHKQKNKKIIFKLLNTLKDNNRKSPLKIVALAAIIGKILITTIRVKLAGRSHNIASPMVLSKQYSHFLKIIINLLNRKQKRGRKIKEILESELNSIINETRSATEIRNDLTYETAIEDFSYLHYRWR